MPVIVLLLACIPWEQREWDCKDFRSLWAVASESIDVYPDPGLTGCARADRQPFDERDFLRTPGAVAPPELDFDDDSYLFESDALPARLSMKLDARTVGYRPDAFDRVQVTWGGDDDGVSSVMLHNGTEVLGRGRGAVGYAYPPDQPDGLHIRCDACTVWIPSPPGSVELDVTEARVRACVDGSTRISGQVGTISLELSSADGRWPQPAAFQILTSVSISYHGSPDNPPTSTAVWLGPDDDYCSSRVSSNDTEGN